MKSGKTHEHFVLERKESNIKALELQRASCAPGDNVKDEEGHRAVFAEQGASSAQMPTAKFLDTLSKHPGVAGETSDADSGYAGQDDRSSHPDCYDHQKKNVLKYGQD